MGSEMCIRDRANMGDQAEADVNEDDIVNFLDIAVFITILANAGS